MPPPDMPLNAAHKHAVNAEEHAAAGFLIPAAEERVRAAEAFQAAMERTTIESAKRTLKMLYNEQTKAAKELHRRIDKLRAENKDPTLSVNPPSPSSPAAKHGSNATLHAAQDASHEGSSTAPYNQPMSDSQFPVDESFMLLGGQRSDPGDAFNQFWNIMQGMLDNLSQPVAFATVPLNSDETSYPPKRSPSRSTIREGSMSSDTEPEEPLVSRMSRKFGLGLSMKPSGLKRASTIDYGSDGEFDEFSIDELSESFCVVPSDSSTSALKAENSSLKTNIESLKAQLAAMDRLLKIRKEQDQQLRDSIVMAKREAQRVMAASTIGAAGVGSSPTPLPIPLVPRNPTGDLLKLTGSPIMLPVTGLNSGREAQYTKRIKELEDEVKMLNGELKASKAENEKHKAVITKFRERWDKLKESAKKKKESRARADMQDSPPIHERIAEDPEGEQEQDVGDHNLP